MDIVRKEVEKMKNSKIEKVMFIIVLLVIGFFAGITYSTYNMQVVEVQDEEQGKLVTIKILEQENDYYYEK